MPRPAARQILSVTADPTERGQSTGLLPRPRLSGTPPSQGLSQRKGQSWWGGRHRLQTVQKAGGAQCGAINKGDGPQPAMPSVCAVQTLRVAHLCDKPPPTATLGFLRNLQRG